MRVSSDFIQSCPNVRLVSARGVAIKGRCGRNVFSFYFYFLGSNNGSEVVSIPLPLMLFLVYVKLNESLKC